MIAQKSVLSGYFQIFFGKKEGRFYGGFLGLVTGRRYENKKSAS